MLHINLTSDLESFCNLRLSFTACSILSLSPRSQSSIATASRWLYAKKVEPEEQQPTESKQEDTPTVSKKPIKPRKKRASKKSDDELSAMKSVT